MDEKKATISFLDFKSDVNARCENEEIVNWLGKEIVIKKRLALYEVLNFVDDVIDNCYQGEEVRTFMPELRDYAIKFCMITYYTNIDLTTPTSEDDDEYIDSAFHPDDFITKSDIIGVINDHIDTNQLDFIIDAIKSKIEYINQTYVAGVMSDIAKVNDVIGDVMPALEALSKEENQTMFNEFMNAMMLISRDGAVQQLAMQQVKNERRD